MAEERARRLLYHAGGGNLRRICGESKAAVNAGQWRQPLRVEAELEEEEGVEVRSSGANSALGPGVASSAAGGRVDNPRGDLPQMELHHHHHRLAQQDLSPASTSSNSSPSPPSPAAAMAMDPAASKLWSGEVAAAGSLARSSQGQNWGAGNWPVADDCIFCKIVHGFAPAFKLYEDEFCVCILDINPLCYGHSLLVPKGHFSSLCTTPPAVAAAMCSVVPVLSSAIMTASSCDSFNMVVNNGEAAGQVVFHTHFHIVPRYSGDGLWTNESVVRKSLSTFKDPMQLTMSVRSMIRNEEQEHWRK